MFTPFFGQCTECPKGKKSWIVVKSLRCAFHNEKHKNRNIAPVINRNTFRSILFHHKPTGEKDVFERIWNTRLHKCEVCGHPIIRKKDEVGMFSHVLSKGADTVLRLDEDFILLMGDGLYPNCDCHPKWEKRTNDMRKIEMWKPIFLLLDEAKRKAHQLRKNKPLYNEKSDSQNQMGSQME